MYNPFGKLLFERWYSGLPSDQKLTLLFDAQLMQLMKGEAMRSWTRRRLWKVFACWADHERLLERAKVPRARFASEVRRTLREDGRLEKIMPPVLEQPADESKQDSEKESE